MTVRTGGGRRRCRGGRRTLRAVHGGEHVAPLGEHVDVLLILSTERVRGRASETRDGVDDQDLLHRHRSQLDARVVGTAPDWMVEDLLADIGELRRFYRRRRRRERGRGQAGLRLMCDGER